MIIDISHYTAQTSIKPELQLIKVYKENGNLITVATDSYRMAALQYNLSATPILNAIEPGYYTQKYFKQLCKDLAKSKTDHMLAIQAFNATRIPLEVCQYPQYTELIKRIESDEKEKRPGISSKYNTKQLIDHIKLCNDLQGDVYGLDVSTMYSTADNSPLVYKKENSYILLMPVLKK